MGRLTLVSGPENQAGEQTAATVFLRLGGWVCSGPHRGTLDSRHVLGVDVQIGVQEPHWLPFAFLSTCLVLVAPIMTSRDRKSWSPVQHQVPCGEEWTQRPRSRGVLMVFAVRRG